ncbi:MAG TPA: hypothetical protein VGL81_25725 [Polyangiaceae bacterium]|jgi:hypothetical protein
MGATRKYLGAGVVGVVTALVLAPAAASADGPACSGWDVEYALNGQLKLADTMMGAADGVYPIGPGKAVIHFDDRSGQPGGQAKLTSYAIHEHVSVTSKALFLSATVVTDTNSRAAPDGNGVIAVGTLTDHTLSWASPVKAFKTDGTMTCDGSLCGKFGAPSPGSTDVHIGPRSFQPPPFQFGPDMKTFSMGFVQTAHADSPKQTTFEAVAGRETKRTCVP